MSDNYHVRRQTCAQKRFVGTAPLRKCFAGQDLLAAIVVIEDDFGETEASGGLDAQRNSSGLGGLRSPADNDGRPLAGPGIQGYQQNTEL